MRIFLSFLLMLVSNFVFAEYNTDKTQLRKLLAESPLDSSVNALLALHCVYLNEDTTTRILHDDSLVIQVLTTTEEKIRVDCLNRLAFLEVDMGNFKNAIPLLVQALSISKKINYRAGLAYQGYYDALLSWDLGNEDLAEKQIIACIHALDKERVIQDLYSPLSSLRLFYNVTRQYEKKLNFYKERLAYYEKNGPYENIGSCYHGFGNHYLLTANYEKSLEYYSRAGENWKSWGNETCYMIIKFVLADKYFEWGNTEYAERLMALPQNLSFTAVTIITYAYYVNTKSRIAISKNKFDEALQLTLDLKKIRAPLGELFAILNNIEIAKIYLLKREADSAKIFLDQTNSLLQGRRNILWTANGDIEFDYCMSEYYKIKGNEKLALFHMQEALSKARKEQYNKLILKYLNDLSKLCTDLGMHDDAYLYLREYHELNDSLGQVDQASRITLYETQRKEKQQETELLLSKEKNKRQQIITYSIAAGFLIMLAFAFLLYNRFRLTKKQSRIITAEKEIAERERQRAESSIVELKAAQAQLIQSEKMASLGELTAGIAHEIQNPLNFVTNFSELSKELIQEMQTAIEQGNQQEVKDIVGDIEQNLEKINHHGKRADAIVKGMLLHSRQSTGEKAPVDVNALVEEYIRLSFHGLRAKDKTINANIKTNFDKNVGKLELVEQDIGRVILNLMNNALYSASQNREKNNNEPIVTVTTKKLENSIEISVTDNGTGIPKHVLDKIFQPFFTTKPTGKGTGLGLSLSYDVVKAHGGSIQVESTEGQGATFIVRLPVGNNLKVI